MEKTFLLPKKAFDKFFRILREFGPVHAPIQVSKQSYSFQRVESSMEIAFEALRTILPAKKFFYPQSEALIKYDRSSLHSVEPEIEKQVLFGVHPCELAGLAIMDTIFSAAPADNNYLKRREMFLIIGLSCMPDKYCFCQSMGTDTPQNGYDLFLTDLGEDYFIESKTPAGQRIISSAQELIKQSSSDDKQRYKDFWNKRSESFTNGFAPDNLRSVMDMESNNEIWQELGERCLSCGNCTPVCPTCYCFDLVDIASLNGEEGERRREWDSCQFTGFAKVSGDYNFRPTPVDRLKFWYRHKLHGFDDPYGFKTCVGCGRCTVSCPAGIDDIVSVVKALQNKKQGDSHESSKQ